MAYESPEIGGFPPNTKTLTSLLHLDMAFLFAVSSELLLDMAADAPPYGVDKLASTAIFVS